MNNLSWPADHERIAQALRRSWSAATSGEWRADNPACGQCNVTALLLDDVFGAEILKTPTPNGDHFYNRIGGTRVDFTESQFSYPLAYRDIAASRMEALAGTEFDNYAALRSAFVRNLGKGSNDRSE